MLKKDLKQFSNEKPQLITHYVKACTKVYHRKPFIPAKLFPKFKVFEDDLRELGIPPRDYAYVVATLMKRFVLSKGWNCLPVPVFLGNYCLNKYKDIAATKTVKVDTENSMDILFHDELLVARVFIEKNVASDGNVIRLRDVVKELKPLLSDNWLQVYVNKDRRPEDDVIDQLVTEYGISKKVTSYLDIVSVLR
jgi:hypothetical protein